MLRKITPVVALTILAVFGAEPALAAPAASSPAQLHYLLGIPVDFILFGLTLLGVAVFHHKTLEVALTGLAAVTVYKLLFTGFGQARASAACAADSPRVGDPRQPVPAADGLCHPVAAFREQPHPGRDAGVPAERLEGRACAARHRVRAVELPRQHRRRPDRRHDGAARVQGQSPYRLPRRHRRSVECRRLRQRRRRHHHHHDVDRRHQPAACRRSLCRGRRGLPDLRHSRCARSSTAIRRS